MTHAGDAGPAADVGALASELIERYQGVVAAGVVVHRTAAARASVARSGLQPAEHLDRIRALVQTGLDAELSPHRRGHRGPGR